MALVLVLTGRKDSPPPVVVAVIIPDAAPPPPDASPPPPPDAASARAKAPTKRELCKSACATSQKKCGVLYIGSCLDTCLAYPEEAIDCLEDAEDDCNGIGACGFEALCGAPPSGRGSCQSTAACMLGCGNDVPCTCRCAASMALPKTNLFLRFASCAIARCASDCQLNAQVCLACVQGSCGASAAACMAQ